MECFLEAALDFNSPSFCLNCAPPVCVFLSFIPPFLHLLGQSLAAIGRGRRGMKYAFYCFPQLIFFMRSLKFFKLMLGKVKD